MFLAKYSIGVATFGMLSLLLISFGAHMDMLAAQVSFRDYSSQSQVADFGAGQDGGVAEAGQITLPQVVISEGEYETLRGRATPELQRVRVKLKSDSADDFASRPMAEITGNGQWASAAPAIFDEKDCKGDTAQCRAAWQLSTQAQPGDYCKQLAGSLYFWDNGVHSGTVRVDDSCRCDAGRLSGDCVTGAGDFEHQGICDGADAPEGCYVQAQIDGGSCGAWIFSEEDRADIFAYQWEMCIEEGQDMATCAKQNYRMYVRRGHSGDSFWCVGIIAQNGDSCMTVSKYGNMRQPAGGDKNTCGRRLDDYSTPYFYWVKNRSDEETALEVMDQRCKGTGLTIGACYGN